MPVPVGTILLGAAALAEQLTTMITRFSNGDMTPEEMEQEWNDINSRVDWSERVMDKAKQRRLERGKDG